MKKKWIRYGVVGIVFYALFLVTGVPAKLVLSFAPNALGPIQPFGVSGSIWSGKAAVVQLGPNRLDDVHWELNALPLLFRTIELNLTTKIGKGKVEGQVGLSMGSDGEIYFNDLEANIKAEDLQRLIQGPNAQAPIGGNLTIDLDELETIQLMPLAAEGRIRWDRASVQLGSDPVILGNFIADFENTDNGIKVQIKDDGGMIGIDGVVNLAPDGNLSLAGTLTPRQDIHPGLKMMFRGAAEKKVNLKGNIKQPQALLTSLSRM